MDRGDGRFAQLLANLNEVEEKKKELETRYPNHGGWFHEGQIIEINGSRFRVKSVKPTELRLKLLPKSQQTNND